MISIRLPQENRPEEKKEYKESVVFHGTVCDPEGKFDLSWMQEGNGREKGREDCKQRTGGCLTSVSQGMN
jgi:hypothetical protein